MLYCPEGICICAPSSVDVLVGVRLALSGTGGGLPGLEEVGVFELPGEPVRIYRQTELVMKQVVVKNINVSLLRVEGRGGGAKDMISHCVIFFYYNMSLEKKSARGTGILLQ